MLHRLSSASDRGTKFVAKQRSRNVRCIIDNRYIAEALRWQRHHFAARRRSQLSCNMSAPFATCSPVARVWPHLVATMWPHLVARSGHSCVARIPFAENKHGHKLWPQSGHTFWICLERNANVVATLWPQLVATFGFSVSAAGVRRETWAGKNYAAACNFGARACVPCGSVKTALVVASWGVVLMFACFSDRLMCSFESRSVGWCNQLWRTLSACFLECLS